MRTVEQISKELRAAREEEKQTKSKREKLEQEMKEIYLAAKAELGIEDKPQVFHRGGLLPIGGPAKNRDTDIGQVDPWNG